MIRILIADDDREDVEIFTKALEKAGVEKELQVVCDGAELLKHLRDEKNPKPDYLFLDLAMPKKSGFECLNHVRRNADYDDIRIIILSDSVNLGQIDDAYDLGANYFLTKPSDLEEFSSLLQHIFSHGKAAHPTRAEFVLMNYHLRSPQRIQ